MAAFDPISGGPAPIPGSYPFQQIPGGGIRPAQAPPASEIYGGVTLKTLWDSLFGGGDQPAATSTGALPSNNQPAVAQGGSPGNQSAAAPALAGGSAPPASPPLMAAGNNAPFWAGGTDVQGPYAGLGPKQGPQAQGPQTAQTGPEMIEQEVERSQAGAKANPEQAKQMAETLEGTGVDVLKAYDEIFEQLGGVEKPKTDLTKEEKGLFIMSFGLRMMAASETMSAGGAFGAAGVPTVQEMRGLQEQRQATARDVTNQRRETALDILRERMRQQEGVLDRAARPQTFESASGLRTYDPNTGQWNLARDPETGQPIKGSPTGADRPFAFERKYQMLRDAGYTHEESTALAVAGAEDASSLYVIFSKELGDMKAGAKVRLPDGRRVTVDKMTNEERDAWIRQQIGNVRGMMTRAEQEERGGGATPPPNAPVPGAAPGAAGAAPAQGAGGLQRNERGIPIVRSPEDLKQLEPDKPFIAPDGSERIYRP